MVWQQMVLDAGDAISPQAAPQAEITEADLLP
jgi:hypothetical protein